MAGPFRVLCYHDSLELDVLLIHMVGARVSAGELPPITIVPARNLKEFGEFLVTDQYGAAVTRDHPDHTYGWRGKSVADMLKEQYDGIFSGLRTPLILTYMPLQGYKGHTGPNVRPVPDGDSHALCRELARASAYQPLIDTLKRVVGISTH